MPPDDPSLPPVEEWWPYISIGARHRIMQHIADPLDDRVRAELEIVIGRVVSPDARLTDDDRHFVLPHTSTVEGL